MAHFCTDKEQTLPMKVLMSGSENLASFKSRMYWMT
jgi:hypothetical protein